MSILIGWYYGQKGYFFKNKTQFKNTILGSNYIKNTLNNNVNELPKIPSNKYWFIPYDEINKWNLGNNNNSNVSPCKNDSPISVNSCRRNSIKLGGFMVDICKVKIETLDLNKKKSSSNGSSSSSSSSSSTALLDVKPPISRGLKMMNTFHLQEQPEQLKQSKQPKQPKQQSRRSPVKPQEGLIGDVKGKEVGLGLKAALNRENFGNCTDTSSTNSSKSCSSNRSKKAYTVSKSTKNTWYGVRANSILKVGSSTSSSTSRFGLRSMSFLHFKNSHTTTSGSSRSDSKGKK